MKKYKNWIGEKVGLLNVIRRAPDKTNCLGSPVIIWECQCECGLIVYRTSYHLKRGRCRCKNCKALDDHKKWGHEEIRTHHWYNIQKQAAKRNIEFEISIEYAWDIFIRQNKRCALSGIPICFAKTKEQHITGGTTASLDRIDSLLGYVEGNVQWLHKWVNLMKSDFTTEEFLDYCNKIVEHNKGEHA